MNKIIPPGSYDFGESVSELIRYSTRGLRGNDLSSFIKRAGQIVADKVKDIQFYAGEIPIHLLALGATEYTGPNRNYDGFKEATCRKYHKTFEKYAKFYRHHQNKDPKKSYGVVKLAHYNEQMGRIELIVALNATKEAAERNKGLVADKELEKLANNEELPVSMSTVVPYDQCVICDNRAPTRAQYCKGIEEGGMCKGGGCKNNLGFVDENGNITYVDNPIVKWADISLVHKGADRTAFVFSRLKQASVGRVKGGAELAEELGLTTPLSLAIEAITNSKLREQIKVAHTLYEAEQELLNGVIKKACCVPNTLTELNDISTFHGTRSIPQLMKALAQEKIAMSLADFVQLVANCNREKAASLAGKIKPYTYNLFSKLYSDTDNLTSALSSNVFSTSECEPTSNYKNYAFKKSADASLDLEAIKRRAWKHAINEEKVELDLSEKMTESNAAYEGLASIYGLYKIAFLYELRNDPDFELLTDLVIRQNYVK